MRSGAVAAALLGVAGVCALAHPPASAQMAVFLVAVSVAGLPHGVLDVPALRSASRSGRLPLARGLSLYLALIAATALGWAVAPAATLVLFLLASAWHFGGEEARAPGEGAGAHAVAVAARALAIFAPLLLAHAETLGWLAQIARTPESAVAATAQVARAPGLALAAAVVCGVAAHALSRGRGGAAAELVALWALFTFAPPLLAFAVYFAGVHAPRHVRRETAGAVAGARLALMGAAAGVAGLLVLAAGWRFGLRGDVVLLIQALAALTTPHLLLAPWLEGEAAAAEPHARRPAAQIRLPRAA